MENNPKILIFDVEISPNATYTWGGRMYDLSAIEIIEEWYLLTVAYQWYGQKTIYVKGNTDFGKYNDDKGLTEFLWDLFDKADIVIGFNSKKFDVKKANSRFAFHKLPAPSGYISHDLIQVYKKHFADNSNKLDYICQKHGLGSKLPHAGFEMWKGCMRGEAKSWKQMKAYNKHDVEITTALYEFLLPWEDSLNLAKLVHHDAERPKCPSCLHDESNSDGIRYVNGRGYRRLICKQCTKRFKQWLTGKKLVSQK